MTLLMADQQRLRTELDANAAEILASLDVSPLDYDHREPLWMERHRMLREMREAS